MRAEQRTPTGSTGGPTLPLTIASISVVQGGIGGSGVSVAATRDSFVATFQPAAIWHPNSRDCLPDVTGTIDATGRAQWTSQAAGHVESMVGDTTSARLYLTSLGDYCQPGGQSSPDGGNNWTSTPLPPGASGGPMWLAFDPANAGTLLAAGDGKLFLSRDAGRTWTAGPEAVVPIGFASTGRLYGWGPGALFESLDDGATWQQIGSGPATQPAAAAALPMGLLMGERGGLWWYPLEGEPQLVRPGNVYSVAPLGEGAVVVGADENAHPWLATFDPAAGYQPLHPVDLPAQLRAMTITGGQVAANADGAAVALSGPSSAICFADFARG
jgi:hypothetical protein